VFSSVIAADVVKGAELVSAVRHGADFIAKVLEFTTELAVPVTDGICFEQYLSEI
jgi:pyridoxine kinase